jgi:hypothetical protein
VVSGKQKYKNGDKMTSNSMAPNPGKNGAPSIDDTAVLPFEDLVTAILFILIGVGAFAIAQDYPMGTMHRMGPGMFPLLISALITLVGIGLAVQALRAKRIATDQALAHRPTITFTALRALFFVMLALLAFAILIRPAGLFLATSTLVFISTRAEPGRGVLGSIILALTLACVSAAIFVYGIGLPISLWPVQ